MKTNIEIFLSFIIKSVSGLLLKLIPGLTLLVNINKWANINIELISDEKSLVEADYYNLSENDIVNLFRELKYLAEEGHSNHKQYLIKRVNFLANEGLNFTDNINLPEYRKLSPDEIQDIFFKDIEKPKRGRKKGSHSKRDKKGRFTSKKK
jgi:hypothetical protein